MWSGVFMCVPVCSAVLMKERLSSAGNLCLFLWPPPQLQRVGNKPLQQSPNSAAINGKLSQPIDGPAFPFLPLSNSASVLLRIIFSLLPSQPLSLSSSRGSFLLSLCFFHLLLHSHPSSTPPPHPLLCLHSFQVSQLCRTDTQLRQLSSSKAINKSRLHTWNM